MKETPSKFAELLHNRQGDSAPEAVAETNPKRGRPGGQGKRLNPDYCQVTAYIPVTLHHQTKINLILNGVQEFSDLVKELLTAWNQQQRRS